MRDKKALLYAKIDAKLLRLFEFFSPIDDPILDTLKELRDLIKELANATYVSTKEGG